MDFTFTIRVTANRDTGKFVGRDELQEALREQLDDAVANLDLSGLGADGESEYSCDAVVEVAGVMSELLDLIVQCLKQGAANIQPTLEPDEDWRPVCMYATRDGEVRTALVPQLAHPTLKYAAAAALGDILAEDGAICCGLINVLWRVVVDEDRYAAILAGTSPRASEAPDRSEMLSIITIDEQGWTGGSTAAIERGGPHPTLGEWRDLPPNTKSTGEIIDPLLDGLARVRKEGTNDA